MEIFNVLTTEMYVVKVKAKNNYEAKKIVREDGVGVVSAWKEKSKRKLKKVI